MIVVNETQIELTEQDQRDLAAAKALLENPGLTARLSGLIGVPIEKGFSKLPEEWSERVHRAAQVALFRVLEIAVTTLEMQGRIERSNLMHKIMVGASGGIGGAFGLPALLLELPISTGLILRSIADVARDQGHDLRSIHTQLSCLEVFALGGRSSQDDASESAYWAVRVALSQAVAEAAAYLSEKRVLTKSAPVIVRLIAAVTSRFGIMLTEEAAAKALPLIGAAGGSIINVLFMSHFQDMARGHFIVRRLEAKYGQEVVQKVYASIPTGMSGRA